MATPKWFGKCFISAFNEEIKNTDTFKMALFTNAHSPDQDADQYYDAANGMTEVTGTGYTTGGKALTGVSFAYDAATNVFAIKFDDVAWTGASFTARYAEIYSDTPSSNKPLLAYVDFGQDETATAGTFTVDVSADGFVKLTIS